MNRTYRNIWNAATGTWTAVAETAKSQSKGSARAALSTVAAVIALGIPFSTATAADSCTAADEQASSADAANTCAIAPSIGAQSRSITSAATPTATLDDTYIQVLPATTGGTAASATGSAAVAIGNSAVANGTSVLAFGSAATATGTGSMAFGRLAAATNTGAIAIGNDTIATGGTGATAIGNNSVANGTSVLAVGSSATATGTGSVALGRLASATANSSTALGNQSSVQAVSGVALGYSASVAAGATNSIAIGNNASVAANVTNAMALGTNSTVTRNDTISVGSAAKQRQITNLAAGTQATDAVNLSQLGTVAASLGAKIDGSTGVVTGPSYDLANGGTQTTVGGALGALDGALTTANDNIARNASDITNLDGRVTTNETNIAQNATDITNLGGDVTRLDSRVTNNESSITQINNALNSGTIGLVQQPGAGADLTVGANTDGTAINFTGTAGERKLTGIANGDIKAGSQDAITGDQLYATNQGVAQNASSITNLGTQVTNLDGRVTTNETNIAQNATDITTINNQLGDLSSGTIGLVQQTGAGADLTVGANTDGAAVNFTGTAGERTLTGIANGDISAGSKDAVTGDQLYATNQGVAQNASSITNLGTQVTNLDGRVTTNETNIAKNASDITTINNQLDDLSGGTIGLVQQAGAGADLMVGANTDGAAVNFTGTAGERTLTGIANGDISAGSTDAITGDQLYTTNQGVAQNASSIANLGTQVTNIDGRLTTNETNIAKNATDITAINNQLGDLSGGTIGLVQQAGAGADLTVGANTDGAAVNFAGTAGERKLTGLANGDVAAGSTDAVTGDQLHATNTSVAHLDQRVTSNETSITQIRSDMNSGTIGLVQQAGAGADLTVGANTDGAAVDFAGTAGERKLTGLANGDVAAGSHDAVTGDQLHATNQAVAQNASDIADNRTDITTINSKLESGQIGLAQQDPATGAITVGAATGGSTVNFAGTGGARTLSGVANGVNDDDAVTIAQLRATGLIDYTGKEIAALTYDDLSLGSATLGGVGGTVLRNVAPGLIAAGSMDAVNGGQLHAMQQDFESRFSGLDDRVAGLESGSTPGDPGNGSGSFDPAGSGAGSVQLGAGADASGGNSTAIGSDASASASNGTAIGSGSNASGSNGTAVGQGSVASGSNGTAIGQGSNASGSNAVALGAGSIADRDNAVSVGSAGNERQITNVAAGTAPTDAVNVQQMQNSVRSVRQDAMGGVAAAMAVAGLPQSTQPGRTFVAMAGSTYGGEYGSALGVSYMTRDGKWTIKASANTSSRGTVGAVVGGGFYW